MLSHLEIKKKLNLGWSIQKSFFHHFNSWNNMQINLSGLNEVRAEHCGTVENTVVIILFTKLSPTQSKY